MGTVDGESDGCATMAGGMLALVEDITVGEDTRPGPNTDEAK